MSATTCDRASLRRLVSRCLACETFDEAVNVLSRFARRLPKRNVRGTWGYHAQRMVRFLRNGETPYAIFAPGNGKLPFYAFSALPDYTCPGAGDCLNWCYSFRAWRYPAAFFRQLQNTLLLVFDSNVIARAFNALPANVDVRLYVDGDFDSCDRVAFWMDLVRDRSDLRVYGYSKSWAQLLEYNASGGAWPANYTLNLSSGSKWEDNPAYAAAVARLPITRGQFVAVPIDGAELPRGSARYDSAEYHRSVREALRAKYGKRVVSCPGKCGDCGNKSHWCGDKTALNDVVIGIGIH